MEGFLRRADSGQSIDEIISYVTISIRVLHESSYRLVPSFALQRNSYTPSCHATPRHIEPAEAGEEISLPSAFSLCTEADLFHHFVCVEPGEVYCQPPPEVLLDIELVTAVEGMFDGVTPRGQQSQPTLLLLILTAYRDASRCAHSCSHTWTFQLVKEISKTLNN